MTVNIVKIPGPGVPGLGKDLEVAVNFRFSVNRATPRRNYC